MAIVRKLRLQKAAPRRKMSKTIKDAPFGGSGAARKAAGICDAQDAELVNAVAKAAAADLAK